MRLSIRRQSVKWVLFGVLGLAACYVVVFAVVLMAMLQTPERFGLFMTRVPTVLVRALPASRMWRNVISRSPWVVQGAVICVPRPA